MSKPPRLSRKQALVLNLLTGAKELYGLELVRASDGELKRGTVYVTLSRMQDAGLVESRLEDPPEGYRGPPRRKYKPTGLGEAALMSWLDGLTSAFRGLRLAGLLVAAPFTGRTTSADAVAVVILMTVLGIVWSYIANYIYNQSDNISAKSKRISELFPRSDLDDKFVIWLRALAIWPGAKNAIETAPGSRIMSVLRTVCGTKCVREIVETTYADFCVDYFAAEEAGNKWRMRFAKLRLYRDLARAIGLFSFFRASSHFVKEVVGTFKG